MEIPFNLRALIEKNNRIALPGIGVFYKKRTEGFFDENRNSFFPPKEDISFSYNPKEENYLDDMPETERNFIGSLLNRIKEAFSNSEEFSIENLGKLKKKGDVIVFEKSVDQHNFNSSFFGLPVLVIPKEELKQEPTPVITPQSQENNTNFSLAEQALSVAIEDSDMEEKQSKPKNWLYVLLTLIILALGGFAFYQYRPDIVEETWRKLYPDPKPAKVPAAAAINTDSLNKQIADSIYNQDIETALTERGFKAERVKDSTDVSIQSQVVPNKNAIRYEIIISAWRTEAKALSELKKLRANGIDAHIVDDAGGLMIKISAATLYSKEEAEKELKRIREELNPEAFIKPIKSLN